MRHTSIVLGVLMIAGAIFGARTIVASKTQRKPKTEKRQYTAYTSTIHNTSIPIKVTESGRLMAKDRFNLFSEVQGLMLPTVKDFRPGVFYRKGETLIKVNANDVYLNLQAQKSTLHRLIIGAVADLKLDYPTVYDQWNAYLNSFDLEKPVPPLPTPKSEQEKRYISGKNIYNQYYNIKSLETTLARYTIKAPFDGIITEALVNQGTVIRPSQRLGEFVGIESYEMQVSIKPSLATNIKKGDEVLVSDPHDSQKTWKGTVSRINGKVDANTQTVRVFVALSGYDLKEGMFLETSIEGNGISDASEVNRKLLVNNKYLYTVVDSTLQLAKIAIEHTTEQTAVVTGLPDGSLLLSRTIPGAHEGMKVSVKPLEKSAK